MDKMVIKTQTELYTCYNVSSINLQCVNKHSLYCFDVGGTDHMKLQQLSKTVQLYLGMYFSLLVTLVWVPAQSKNSQQL